MIFLVINHLWELLGGSLTCEELVGVNWISSDCYLKGVLLLCEELSGGLLTGDDEGYSIEMTSSRLIPVAVCEVQVVPSGDP